MSAMSPRLQAKHDMIVALQEQVKQEHAVDLDHQDCVIDAAIDLGFLTEDLKTFTCTRTQLLAFGAAAEGAGRFTFARRAGMPLADALAVLQLKEGEDA